MVRYGLCITTNMIMCLGCEQCCIMLFVNKLIVSIFVMFVCLCAEAV